jgi:hypothetical protein
VGQTFPEEACLRPSGYNEISQVDIDTERESVHYGGLKFFRIASSRRLGGLSIAEARSAAL